MITKIIVATFFPVYPVTFGSSVVISSFFDNLPFKDKKLYQISNQKKKINNNKIKSIFPINNSKLFKFFSIIVLIKKIILELRSSKNKNILFIEGASWIGYSFLLILFTKIFSLKTKIIYRGHSIEYEIRKKNSNIIISNLSFFFEKFVYKNSLISTAVSKIEMQKVKKYYGVKPFVFPNVINFKQQRKKKSNINKKYILYSGSYDYQPNKIAIDRLYYNIMPKLIKKFPNIILVLTGSNNIPYKAHWLKNLGLISKDRYINILCNSLCLVVPTKEGYGTRVKIIEALCNGVVVVSSKIGIEGISYVKKSPPPFECFNDLSFINAICKINKNKIYKKKSNKKKIFYIKNYNARLKVKSFLREINDQI